MPKKKDKKKKSVAPVFHILCEGEKTEPYYIKSYISQYHPESRSILVVEDSKQNTPVSLVKEAIKRKDSCSSDKDVFWVIYDRESVAKYPDNLHLEARNLAKKNNIEIGLSNVCIEYWLLLHVKYTTAAYDCCDSLLKQSAFKKILKERGIPCYDKGLPYLFDIFKDDVEDALKNAQKLKESAEKDAEKGRELPHHMNPYVDVHEMFLDMNNFIEGKPSIRS
jgi:hypothetical protein